MTHAPLAPGFHDVPRGHVATIVTHLEMTARPTPRALPQTDLTLVRHSKVDVEWYRAIFRAVGQDWLWFSRLRLSPTDLSEIINHTQVEIWSVAKNGQDLGLLELDFREEKTCELAFFGLVPKAIGQGAGRLMMETALSRAFSRPITRLHVHTCTLDSPQSLAFYQRSGFTPVAQQIEIAPDPRIMGEMSRNCAPHIPYLP